MPWANDPESRRQSAATYSDPEYQANRRLALQRANGRCEQCGTSSRPLHVDHITNRANGGSHHHTNLQVLCSGPGSCHARKTAREGRTSQTGDSKDPEPARRTAW